MAKLTGTIFAVIMSLMLITIGYVIASSITIDEQFILYTSNTKTALGGVNYGSLVSDINDAGDFFNLSKATASQNEVAMGNSSVCILPGAIKHIPASDWVVTFYGISNITDVANWTCTILLCNAGGTTNATLATAGDVDSVDYILDTNSTTTVTFEIPDTNVTAGQYLKILWYTDKIDTTAVHDDLFIGNEGGLGTYILITATVGLPTILGNLMILVGVVVMLAITVYVVRVAIRGGKK